MKLLIVVLLLIVPAVVMAQPKATAAARAEAELRAIEETRRQAIKNGDEKTLNSIYADDFTAIAGNGTVINKQQLMAVFRRNDPSTNFTTDEITIRIFGSTALFTGRLTGRKTNGEVVSSSRFSHLFVKRGRKWQCVAGQSTPAAQS